MDWNVVVTVRDEFERAEEELAALGAVSRTEYFNVLVMRVDDREAFLRRLTSLGELMPDFLDRCVARATPARSTFTFQSAEEFEDEAARVIRELAPELAGRTFHLRMHRRGFGQELASDQEERELAGAVYDRLDEEGLPRPRVTFDDPDAVVVIETVSNRAGISLWTREDLERYPFLDPG